jgi:hypothetical protein
MRILCRVFFYVLSSKGLFTQNLSPRESVYRVVAQQRVYMLRYIKLKLAEVRLSGVDSSSIRVDSVTTQIQGFSTHTL